MTNTADLPLEKEITGLKARIFAQELLTMQLIVGLSGITANPSETSAQLFNSARAILDRSEATTGAEITALTRDRLAKLEAIISQPPKTPA